MKWNDYSKLLTNVFPLANHSSWATLIKTVHVIIVNTQCPLFMSVKLIRRTISAFVADTKNSVSSQRKRQRIS